MLNNVEPDPKSIGNSFPKKHIPDEKLLKSCTADLKNAASKTLLYKLEAQQHEDVVSKWVLLSLQVHLHSNFLLL